MLQDPVLHRVPGGEAELSLIVSVRRGQAELQASQPAIRKGRACAGFHRECVQYVAQTVPHSDRNGGRTEIILQVSRAKKLGTHISGPDRVCSFHVGGGSGVRRQDQEPACTQSREIDGVTRKNDQFMNAVAFHAHVQRIRTVLAAEYGYLHQPDFGRGVSFPNESGRGRLGQRDPAAAILGKHNRLRLRRLPGRGGILSGVILTGAGGGLSGRDLSGRELPGGALGFRARSGRAQSDRVLSGWT